MIVLMERKSGRVERKRRNTRDLTRTRTLSCSVNSKYHGGSLFEVDLSDIGVCLLQRQISCIEAEIQPCVFKGTNTVREMLLVVETLWDGCLTKQCEIMMQDCRSAKKILENCCYCGKESRRQPRKSAAAWRVCQQESEGLQCCAVPVSSVPER